MLMFNWMVLHEKIEKQFEVRSTECVSTCSVAVPVKLCLVAEASGQDSRHLTLDTAGII